jgi:hypothetical protein
MMMKYKELPDVIISPITGNQLYKESSRRAKVEQMDVTIYHTGGRIVSHSVAWYQNHFTEEELFIPYET